jgi:hypothetical protein
MSRKAINPLLKTVARALQKRDRLELRAVNALLSSLERKRRQKQAARKRIPKRRR